MNINNNFFENRKQGGEHVNFFFLYRNNFFFNDAIAVKYHVIVRSYMIYLESRDYNERLFKLALYVLFPNYKKMIIFKKL